MPIKCPSFLRSTETDPVRGRKPQRESGLREVSPTAVPNSRATSPVYRFKQSRDEMVKRRDVSPTPEDVGPSHNRYQHVVYGLKQKLKLSRPIIGYMSARSLSPTRREGNVGREGWIFRNHHLNHLMRISLEKGSLREGYYLRSPWADKLDFIPLDQLDIHGEPGQQVATIRYPDGSDETIPVRSSPSAPLPQRAARKLDYAQLEFRMRTPGREYLRIRLEQDRPDSSSGASAN